jgi:phospholipid-binding lipoprotein MlaA
VNIIRKVILSLTFVVLLQSFSSAMEKDSLPDDIIMDEDSLEDRLEKANRKIFIFNNYLDASFFTFTSAIYLKVTRNNKIRSGISRMVKNFNEPKNLVNHLLYGNLPGFFKSSARFIINSTLGLGGFFDLAEKKGLPREELDFSTLLAAKLCWKNGTYLIIPVLGPSTARNTFGLLIDKLFIDPLNYLLPIHITLSKFFLEIILLKEEQAAMMQELSNLSLDSYAALLSLYSQSHLAKEYNLVQEVKFLFDKQ